MPEMWALRNKMKCPTPKQFNMKWLPKRKSREERQERGRQSDLFDQVTTTIKNGYTTGRVDGVHGQKDVDLIRLYVEAAGWSMTITSNHSEDWCCSIAFELTPLAEERSYE